MPRYPDGDRAMTDAERQRKRRARLRQERGQDSSPDAVIDALRKENACLRERDDGRRDQYAALDKAARQEIERLRQEIERLRRQLAASKTRIKNLTMKRRR